MRLQMLTDFVDQQCQNAKGCSRHIICLVWESLPFAYHSSSGATSTWRNALDGPAGAARFCLVAPDKAHAPPMDPMLPYTDTPWDCHICRSIDPLAPPLAVSRQSYGSPRQVVSGLHCLFPQGKSQGSRPNCPSSQASIGIVHSYEQVSVREAIRLSTPDDPDAL